MSTSKFETAHQYMSKHINSSPHQVFVDQAFRERFGLRPFLPYPVRAAGSLATVPGTISYKAYAAQYRAKASQMSQEIEAVESADDENRRVLRTYDEDIHASDEKVAEWLSLIERHETDEEMSDTEPVDLGPIAPPTPKLKRQKAEPVF